jgi:hypothetical protein
MVKWIISISHVSDLLNQNLNIFHRDGIVVKNTSRHHHSKSQPLFFVSHSTEGNVKATSMSTVISTMGYHVLKPVVEPMLLRLVACGARRWSGGEPCSWLRFYMNAINLFSKSSLTLSSIFTLSDFLYLSRFL